MLLGQTAERWNCFWIEYHNELYLLELIRSHLVLEVPILVQFTMQQERSGMETSNPSAYSTEYCLPTKYSTTTSKGLGNSEEGV